MGRPVVLNPDELVSGPPIRNPRVADVEPLDGHLLRLLFKNGEVRIFDVAPYLEYPVFRPLRDSEVFQQAWIEGGSVEWQNGAGLSYDTLYLDSEPTGEVMGSEYELRFILADEPTKEQEEALAWLGSAGGPSPLGLIDLGSGVCCGVPYVSCTVRAPSFEQAIQMTLPSVEETGVVVERVEIDRQDMAALLDA